MSNVRNESWKTFWRFALSIVLYYLPFAGVIVLLVTDSATTETLRNNVAEFYANSAVFEWLMNVSSLLIITFFLGRRYVNLSPGLIKQENVWRFIGLLLLVVVADISIELSIVDLPAYHNLFPEEWNETLKDETQITFSSVLNVCLLAPIAEEITFRGVLFGGLLRMSCHPWIAILLSAIVFGAIHMAPMTFLGVTIGGVIYGWLFWRTKSIIPCIIAHIVNNTSVFAYGAIQECLTGPYQEEYTPNATIDVVVIFIAIPMLFFALHRINKMVPATNIHHAQLPPYPRCPQHSRLRQLRP